MSQNWLVWEKSHMFGDQSVRSEVFCVKVEDTQEEDCLVFQHIGRTTALALPS